MKTLFLTLFCLMLGGIASADPPQTAGGAGAGVVSSGGGGSSHVMPATTVPKVDPIDKTGALTAQQGVPVYAAIAWAMTDSAYPAYPAVRPPVAMGALVQPAGALEVATIKIPGFTSIIGSPYVPKAVTLAVAPNEVSLSGVFDHLHPRFIVMTGGSRGELSSPNLT